MGVYIYLIVGLTLFSIIEKSMKVKNSKLIYTFIILSIIVVQGLRSFSVGTDLISYRYVFETSTDLTHEFQLFDEPLYKILNILISVLGGRFRTLLFVVSGLIYIPASAIIYKYSKNSFLSLLFFVLLGFFTFSLSGLRQAIAISVTLFAFKYAKGKNILKFILCIFIAFLFHKSAFIALMIYPLYNIRIKKNHFYFIIPTLLLIFIFRRQIFDILYVLYDSNYKPSDSTSFNFLIMLIAFYTLTIYLFWKKRDGHINGLSNILLFAIIIQIFSSYSNIAMRFGYYFYIYLILLIPEQIYSIKDKPLKYIYSSFVILFLIITFVTSLSDSVLNVYPYEFLLNDYISKLNRGKII